MDIGALRSQLLEAGQEHLLHHWVALGDTEKQRLYKDLSSINYTELNGYYARCKEEINRATEKVDDNMEPLPKEYVGGTTRSDAATIADYENEGMRQIANNKVGVLLLAGGQGTRLGVSYPKGIYDVGMPSQKTLYQLQAERILRLQQLVKQRNGKSGVIPWYIMTSEHTMQQTKEFFDTHKYFGLKPENVIFFEQRMLPCISFEGKIILEEPHKVARAPDGNGGLYRTLVSSGVLDDLDRREIDYIHVYCVDNILVKMADPVFMGFCIKKGAPCGAKVVEKVVPTESVGVLCKVDGIYQVVEYSEITLKTAERRNPDGRLTFSAGNICNHFFTRDFLRNVVISRENELEHHIAKKKIPYCADNGEAIQPKEPNGIKMEKFVFDVFKFASELAVWEVEREEEFSPLKNADGAAKDTPTTSRVDLSACHRRYLERAGASVVETTTAANSETMLNGTNGANTPCDAQFEISPLLSYAGEGLGDLVNGLQLRPPVLLYSTDESQASVKNIV